MGQMTKVIWTTVHQMMLLKMIRKMKTLNLMMEVEMVNLIILVTSNKSDKFPQQPKGNK